MICKIFLIIFILFSVIACGLNNNLRIQKLYPNSFIYQLPNDSNKYIIITKEGDIYYVSFSFGIHSDPIKIPYNVFQNKE